jgi:N-acetylmuramic acid 6-phosphate etherase
MITTAAMIRIGKVYNNLMVDLLPLNSKLVDRAKRLISEVTDCSRDEAEVLYKESSGNVRVAILIHLLDLESGAAKKLLEESDGSLNRALDAKGYHK